MQDIDLDKLDPVSRNFVRYVAENRPDWTRYLRATTSTYRDVQVVELEFPNPVGCRADHPLSVCLDGEEATIHFDMHHAHLPWPEDHSGGDSRPAVLAELDGWMREDAVSASILCDGRLRLSSRIRPDEIPLYEEDEDGDATLRVRSWQGRFDLDRPVRWGSMSRWFRIPVFR